MQTKQRLDTFHSRKMIFYNFSVCSTFGRSICYFHKQQQNLFLFSLHFVFSPFALRVYCRCIVNLLTSYRVFIHCIFISHCTAVYASAQLSSIQFWLSQLKIFLLAFLCVYVQIYNNSAHTFAWPVRCVLVCVVFVIAIACLFNEYVAHMCVPWMSVCAPELSMCSLFSTQWQNVQSEWLHYQPFTLFENKANVTCHPLNSIRAME